MNPDQYLTVQFDEQTSILTLTLDRQDATKNQIGSGTILALREVLYPERIKPRARGLILRSAKEKVFSTGADIEGELKDLNSVEAVLFSSAGGEVFSLLTSLSCPSVALLSGFTLGGGLELALCCDFRIATKSVRMGFPEINLGVLPGWGGTQRLPRLIGQSRALRMILSGDPVNAATGLEYGLVDELVDGFDDLLPAGQRLLGKYTAKSRSAVALARRAVHEGAALPLSAALALEGEIFGLAWGTDDRVEGINAFMEKRKPKWPD